MRAGDERYALEALSPRDRGEKVEAVGHVTLDLAHLLGGERAARHGEARYFQRGKERTFLAVRRDERLFAERFDLAELSPFEHRGLVGALDGAKCVGQLGAA